MTTGTTSASSPRRRRVDADPVRVFSDGRIAYWTGGVPGEGRRVFTTAPPGRTPEEHAEGLRSELGLPSFAKGGRAILQLAIDYFRAHGNTATTRKYRSAVNNHVLPVIGNVACRSFGPPDVLDVTRSAIELDLSENTVHGVLTALSALVSWGVSNDWFDGHPYGDRKSLNRTIRNLLASRYDDDPDDERGIITVDSVPDHDAVARCAAELDCTYRGGRHVVAVMRGSGVRIAEMVAVRVDDVDLDTLCIRVRRQARRDRPWGDFSTPGPRGASTGRTKSRSGPRTVQVWSNTRTDLEWLVDHAIDGWLVPPDRDQRWWLEAFNKRLSAACVAAGWPEGRRGHWLRHHFATYSLAAPPTGYGLDVHDVSIWLGHSSVTVTLERYRHTVRGAYDLARRITERGLG